MSVFSAGTAEYFMSLTFAFSNVSLRLEQTLRSSRRKNRKNGHSDDCIAVMQPYICLTHTPY